VFSAQERRLYPQERHIGATEAPCSVAERELLATKKSESRRKQQRSVATKSVSFGEEKFFAADEELSGEPGFIARGPMRRRAPLRCNLHCCSAAQAFKTAIRAAIHGNPFARD
jgi:hypothetical protein